MSVLDRLAAGARVAEPVAVVVAHPDDESLWAGAALRLLDDATLIHLTDGAPFDMADAARLGFSRRSDYAAARAAELDAALAALGASPRRIGYGIADQQLADDLPGLVRRLSADLEGMAAVLTHPYEGGHPDHDAAAFAVARVGVPEHIEFACYPTVEGRRAFGRFWPDPAAAERVCDFDTEVRAAVHAAIAAHASQAGVIGDWRPDCARYRHAPSYDFAAPPPPGLALYDSFGWMITSREFCARAWAAG